MTIFKFQNRREISEAVHVFGHYGRRMTWMMSSSLHVFSEAKWYPEPCSDGSTAYPRDVLPHHYVVSVKEGVP
jgi:hypothetical protein